MPDGCQCSLVESSFLTEMDAQAAEGTASISAAAAAAGSVDAAGDAIIQELLYP